MSSGPSPIMDIDSHPVFSYEPFGDPDPVRFVYHYTRWERLLDIMHTGLRLGPLPQMNDPRESKDWYIPFTLRGDAITSDEVSTFNATVAEYKQRIRIAAFSRDQSFGNADNQARRGYARPRMWAQYADNHRGACIVFRREGLDEAIRQRYPDISGSWVRGAQVEYVETRLEDPISRAVVIEPDRDIKRSVLNHLTAYGDKLFFVKHIDWRDELEYRWVYYDVDESATGGDGNRTPFVSIKDHVAALVLGADYSNANLPVAQMFAQEHNLGGGVVRCRWSGLHLGLVVFADDGGRWVPWEPA